MKCYRFSGSRKSSKMKRRNLINGGFEEELRKIYPDYEILSEYIDQNTEVLLKCRKHNITFSAKPRVLLRTKSSGCPECIKIENSRNFIEYLKNQHPNIDYIQAQKDYINYYTPIKLYCIIHPDESIYMAPYKVKKAGRNGKIKKFLCKSCKKDFELNNKLNNWIDKFNKKFPNHNYDFDNAYYDIDYYDSGKPVAKIKNILCKDCGKIFSAKTDIFLLSGLCPECRTKSTGEIFVESWLETNNLDFVPQLKISNDLIEGKFKQSGVIVDFSVQYKNKQYWIEYNGEQHYTWCQHFQSLEKFEGQLKRDSNVRNYCKNNDIILIEIPYKYYTKESVWKLLDDIIINGISPDDIISYPEIKYNRKVGG